MSEDRPTSDRIADAIATKCDGMFVTHYIVAAAVIAPDGEPLTIKIASPGLPLWMQHGLLSYEASATAAQPVWSHDDDE